MALTEDLSIFLADFGVVCTAGSVTGRGILDMPTQVLAGDQILSTEYVLTARAVDFGNLAYGSGIEVDGLMYEVRDTRLIDDGRMCELSLSRVTTTNLLQVDEDLDGGGPTTVLEDSGVLDGGGV